MASNAAPDSYFGVQSCGCITAWMSNDEHATMTEIRRLYRVMAETGRAVQMGNLADVRDQDHFIPVDGCPHEKAAL